ncbi:hypothetical protein ACIQ7N_12750 [Lysinibacillus sp. NPDC095746]|uniref:hypothetical protein n=1 Tax=Lysinibacillus sp. NPDC095746 TaxID=3364134 RepID=UPI0037F39A49
MGVSELTVLVLVYDFFPRKALKHPIKLFGSVISRRLSFNNHSGYPPISLDSTAIFYICTLLGYTVYSLCNSRIMDFLKQFKKEGQIILNIPINYDHFMYFKIVITQ